MNNKPRLGIPISREQLGLLCGIKKVCILEFIQKCLFLLLYVTGHFKTQDHHLVFLKGRLIRHPQM